MIDLDAVPTYSQLTVLEGDLKHAWGVFGADDDKGTTNFITPESVRRASLEVRTGQRIPLSLPLSQPDPPYYGRAGYRHDVFLLPSFAADPETDRLEMQDDVLDNFYLQSSTQWDGLRHAGDRRHGYYQGLARAQVSRRGGRLGISHWSDGIMGRGVLVDVYAHALSESLDYDPCAGQEISVGLLRRVLAAQGTELLPGDVLLLRTGYRRASLDGSAQRWAEVRAGNLSTGLAADAAMAEFLWDSRACAIAADNPGVEALPHTSASPFLHLRLITMLGFAMGEFFDLEALATVCAEAGRFTCLFVGIPLNLPGGVGSPANAIGVL